MSKEELKKEFDAWENCMNFFVTREFLESHKVKYIDDISQVKFFAGKMHVHYDKFALECVYKDVNGKWIFEYEIDNFT